MNKKLYNKLRGICLFALPLLLVAGMVACSDSPTMTERFEATGELQGQVIDRSTGDAVSDVAVTLLYREEDSDGNLTEDFEDTRTTDDRGRFSFKDVPVNTDGKGSENGDRKSQPYMLQLDTNGNENYRSSYLAEVDVVFESTGGDGAAVNMTSNVTIPLSKRSVEVGGKVVSDRDTNEPLEDATVEIYQMFDPVVNGNGGTQSTMYLTSTSTNGSGEFSFSNVEESAEIFFRVKDSSDNTHVVNWDSGTFDTPSSSDGSASLDVGTLRVDGEDQSSKFNVTVIGKAVQEGTEAPLDGVNVYLRYNNINNPGIIDSTTTAENGSFEFEGVEEGQNMLLDFKKLDDENEVYDGTETFSTPSVRGETTITEDVGNVSLTPQDRSGAFYVMSVTPEQGADLESDELEFVFEFNRPVVENSYTRDDLGFGSGTFIDDISFSDDGPKKLFGGDLDFTAEFSEDRTSLTITPDLDGLRDANKYRLMTGGAFNDNSFTDENDKGLEFGNNFPFQNFNDAAIREFSINDNDAAPHTPEIAITQDPDNIDWDAVGVTVEWTADESETDIKQYEVWVSENGEPFEHENSVNPDNFAFGEISSNVIFDELVNRRGNRADSPKDVRIKVRAISANLVEGEFSNTITVVDNVDPEVDGATQNTVTQLTINFNEPMDKASVEGAMYTMFDGAGDEVEMDIESVEYFIDNPNFGPENPRVVIILDEDSENDFTDAEEVEVEGTTDLAGNELDEEENSATF